jgi:hypothetical protein
MRSAQSILAAATKTRHNPNCDGSHCLHAFGAVKVYPLGGGGNLILCRRCWAHENSYRESRKNPGNFPTVEWDHAETYGPDMYEGPFPV